MQHTNVTYNTQCECHEEKYNTLKLYAWDSVPFRAKHLHPCASHTLSLSTDAAWAHKSSSVCLALFLTHTYTHRSTHTLVLRPSFTHNNLALVPAMTLFHCRLVLMHEHIHFSLSLSLLHSHAVSYIIHIQYRYFAFSIKTYNHKVLHLGPVDRVKLLTPQQWHFLFILKEWFM